MTIPRTKRVLKVLWQYIFDTRYYETWYKTRADNIAVFSFLKMAYSNNSYLLTGIYLHWKTVVTNSTLSVYYCVSCLFLCNTCENSWKSPFILRIWAECEGDSLHSFILSYIAFFVKLLVLNITCCKESRRRSDVSLGSLATGTLMAGEQEGARACRRPSHALGTHWETKGGGVGGISVTKWGKYK